MPLGWRWGGEWWSTPSWHLGFIRCLAMLSCSTGRASPGRPESSARELNLSQIQRSFETLPGFKRIILIEGSRRTCAWHVLGHTLGISSTPATFVLSLRDHCLCHGSDGTLSEENQVTYSSSCFAMWVQSLEWIIFAYNFHVYFKLLVFCHFSFWGALVLWLHGAFSSERE